MDERDRQRLADIVQYGGELFEYMRGVSLEGFRADRSLQLVAQRLLEIVGEAGGGLSPAARADIPANWAALRGMRNVLAHQYGRIDVSRLYLATTEHLEELLETVESAIND